MDDKRSKILEEELKASQERRYRDLFERVRHGLFVSTKDGRFIDCNQAMLDMLGYESKEEFLSINIEKDLYVNPEDRRRFQREIEEKGYVKDYEINFKKKTGEEISVLVTCNSLLDNKGEVIGYQGLNIDITERKRMEREVREATKRFQKISEMGDDGIIVFDQVYQIEFANMMAVDITGFSQEELMGMDFNLLLNERDQKFLADMHSEVGEDENRRLCLEMEINTAAGGSKEVEVCITIAKGEGRGLRTYAYIRDITLRKKMEREIREANEFLSKMIESSVNCVVATDMKGDILIFNKGAEKLLGYKTEEVVGKMSIRNVYPPGVAKEVMEKMRSPDYGEVGRLESLPMVHKNRKGEAIDGSLSASIIYDNKGNEIATVGIFTDLRPRLKMEERLREAQQQLLQSEKLAAMGRLTSQVAHELNNPIYGIMNTLELLKTEIPSDSKRRRILDLSLSETQRLSEMLRSMLSFSKPQEEVRRKIDINRLIEDILLFLEKQLRESNVKIKTKLNQNISHITASPNQIRQVILNIAANAKEAMPKGGTLTVETLSKNNQIVIKIRDTGVGIPGEIRDKIFDAFFTTKQKIKGVGLGLSVCYGIIKDHGGDIRVKSKTGEGSTFSIILPQKPSSK
ncbi:MAG: PAS domain S-box protein [Thermodesulfobacteriota bacterium]|jgi:two-component system NtrC family sensor kinase